MQIEILGDGAFESALVHLQPGERFISESGALYRASGNVQIDVTTSARGSGGILGGAEVFRNQFINFVSKNGRTI